MTISAILITLNEEQNILRCLQSLAFCNEIIIVDSGSTDRTLEIARQFTLKIFSNYFIDFSNQKNFALSKSTCPWVLSIDADECVSPELKTEILRSVRDSQYAGYRMKRVNYFLGKPLLFGGPGSDWPLRLFRRQQGIFKQPIHEYIEITGTVGKLINPILHYSTETLAREKSKTESYTELEIKYLTDRQVKVSKITILIRPVFTFLYHYIFKTGFFDGKAGFLYAFFAARYCFIKYKKMMAYERKKYLESKIYHRFDEHSPYLPDAIDTHDSRLNKLLTSLDTVENKTILEVGCGKCRFAQVIQKRNARVIGMDPSIKLLEKAKQLTTIQLIQGGACDLPFKNKTFDAVYAVEVIEHIPVLQPAIQEMCRILKPNGKIIIIDRNKYSLSNRRFLTPNALIKKWHEIKNDWMYPRNFPYREQWFSIGQVKKIMNPFFSQVQGSYIMSDSEKQSKWKMIFQHFSFTRHFILWSATKP